MAAILIFEMRGFEKIASVLAHELSPIGVTPERVRAAAIEIIGGVRDKISSTVRPKVSEHIGGDTWYFTFSDLELAIGFGVRFLSNVRDLAGSKAAFFLKPSGAVTVGTPRIKNGRFLARLWPILNRLPASRDAEDWIVLDDLMSALEHELHAAEVAEGGPTRFDV